MTGLAALLALAVLSFGVLRRKLAGEPDRVTDEWRSDHLRRAGRNL